MIGDLRAQERQPCPWPNTHCGVMPEHATRMGRCVGCAGDGTRWVVAGTLREDQPGWHGDSALYVIEASS